MNDPAGHHGARKGPLAAHDATKQSPGRKPRSRLRFAGGYLGDLTIALALRWTISSLFVFLIVEGLIFRTGWYENYLEPESSAGVVEDRLYWLRTHAPGSVPEILVVGDSRVGEGFSAPAADDAAGKRVRFWNFGVAGATPRVWYYELRDADPTRRRFAAIVFALDHYSDEDGDPPVEDRITDLNFAIARLRLTDCPDFAFSMSSFAYRGKAFAGCLLKGIPLRSDLQHFLANIRLRIARSKQFHDLGLEYINDYDGRDSNLHGLSADLATRKIHFPPGIDAEQHDTIVSTVTPDPAPDTGQVTAYRQHWLGRILDVYKDSPTRIVFLQLPRAPLRIPENPVPPRFLTAALTRPRVTALPRETFEDLERPELFFDGYHLNRAGRALFSARLAELVRMK